MRLLEGSYYTLLGRSMELDTVVSETSWRAVRRHSVTGSDPGTRSPSTAGGGAFGAARGLCFQDRPGSVGPCERVHFNGHHLAHGMLLG